MSDKLKYFAKLFFGSAIVYLVIDNATGTQGITSATFGGLSGLLSTAQGRTVPAGTTVSPKAA